MRVRLRREGESMLAYFIDARRIIGVNEVGARILDLRLNQERALDDIARDIAGTFGFSVGQAARDVGEFLTSVLAEVEPKGFSDVGQDQLQTPLGVELEITTACNLRCRHCYQPEHAEVFMPTERAVEIIETLARHGVFEVAIIGGEPFKHPGLFRLLDACDGSDLTTNIVTNGTLLTPETVADLQRYKRLALLVSLDGTEAVQNALRGNGTFAKVDAALRRLRDANVPVEVMCTLNAINVDVHEQVLEYCQGLGIPCNFNLFKPFGPAHESLVLSPNRFFRVVTNLIERRRATGDMIGIANSAIVAEVLGLEPRNECRANRSGLVINVHGELVPCPWLAASGFYQAETLPDFDERFLDTWTNHPAFAEFRQRGFRECQARASIFSGDACGRDPYGITAFREFRRRNLPIIS